MPTSTRIHVYYTIQAENGKYYFGEPFAEKELAASHAKPGRAGVVEIILDEGEIAGFVNHDVIYIPRGRPKGATYEEREADKAKKVKKAKAKANKRKQKPSK